MLKRLDAMDAALNDLKAKQQAVDQKLSALIAQVEDNAREIDDIPEEVAPKPPPKPQPSPSVGKPTPPSNPAGTFENQAMLTPTASFNLAYNDYLKGNYDLAIAGFESFLRQYP
jgi:TolA-binding protein